MPQKRSARAKKLSRKETRDLDVKITFLEGIVKRDGDYVEASLEPRNPLVFYNLACSYSLTREFDLAVSALEKALSLGYRDFKWLAKDPDLRLLRQHPLYRAIADKIRRMKVRIT